MSKGSRSRREFMDVTGAGLVAAASGSWLHTTPAIAAAGVEPREADLVVFNAKVYTVDASVPTAEAFAIKAGRFNGAYASHEEAIKGSIGVGKLADFVVLSDDLHAVPADKIKDIQIVRTVVGGSTVYKA